jgi:hypothetical protein
VRGALVVVVAVLLLAGSVLADIPQMVGYQGMVTDNSGNPVADGTYTMRFRIYTAVTGGTLLWDSNNQSVTLAGGVFSVMLGESPQPALSLDFDQDYWLLVTFSGQNQSPRKRLGSVGYAYMASGVVPGTLIEGSVTAGTYSALRASNTAASGTAYGMRGQSASTSGVGVYGAATANTGTNYGGRFYSTSTGGRGIYAYTAATTGSCYGVYGWSASESGRGVYGKASAGTGTCYGLYGESDSPSGRGVYGMADATSGFAYGGRFQTPSLAGYGVYAWASSNSGTTFGVYGQNSSTGGQAVHGAADAGSGTTYGGRFTSSSTSGTGVRGSAQATSGTTYGVYGEASSSDGTGVYGIATRTTGGADGGWFESRGSGFGVCGKAARSTGTAFGVYGITMSPIGYSGGFNGDVFIAGNLQKGSGSFLIDHPLDPENKLLRHNFVESPENLLIYRGTVRLDARGEAVVAMPDYFIALTKENEATVTVTPVGRPFLAGHEWDAEHGSFTAYGDPGREVTWIVCADRDDPVIHQLGAPVVEEKGPDSRYCDRGRLIYPAAYGYPKSMGWDHELQQRMERMRIAEEQRRAHDELVREAVEQRRAEDARLVTQEEPIPDSDLPVAE